MNWIQRLIKGLGRRGSNAPLSFDEWLATPPPKIAAAINRHLDREIDREIARRQRASFPTLDQAIASNTLRRRGSNPPAPGNKPAAPAGPPAKPRPTGGRLIYVDRDPGPVQPRLPDDLADLPVLPAEMLDGAAAPPAEMPSDELLGRWKRAAIAEYLNDCVPTWRTAALLAFAEGRRQAQSLQIPPPGADPVATDWGLMEASCGHGGFSEARRAIYERGRADERTAILRALGVEP